VQNDLIMTFYRSKYQDLDKQEEERKTEEITAKPEMTSK
jgi:hypothetical protein